jgi:hypothetical protein
VQKVEPIVLNRVGIGPGQRVGDDTFHLLEGQRTQLLALAKPVTQPAAQFSAPNSQRRVLDIARYRSRESGRK